MTKKSSNEISPWVADWDSKNPRLKWKGLSNDERVMIKLAFLQKQSNPVKKAANSL